MVGISMTADLMKLTQSGAVTTETYYAMQGSKEYLACLQRLGVLPYTPMGRRFHLLKPSWIVHTSCSAVKQWLSSYLIPPQCAGPTDQRLAGYLGDSCSWIWVVGVTSLMTRQTCGSMATAEGRQGRCDDVDECALIRVRTVSWRPRFAL